MTREDESHEHLLPSISIVIPVRDRWMELETLLQSLLTQEAPPVFDVTIVNDGSTSALPTSTRYLIDVLSAQLIETPATGISAARNIGVRSSNGEVIAFIDSDCIPASDYLSRAWHEIENSSERSAYQGMIVGSDCSMVSRIEHIRVGGITASKTRLDGTTTYANTSAFFIKREVFNALSGFDETVTRGEDSLLLYQLLANDDPPMLLPHAMLEHRPRMTLLAYIAKHFKIGRHTLLARHRLAFSSGGRLNHVGRMRVIHHMRRLSKEHSLPIASFSMAILCYAIECSGRLTAAVSYRR